MKNGKFGELMDISDDAILITMNLNEDKLKIYSNKIQEIDLVHFSEKDESDKKYTQYTFYAEDQDGRNCHVTLAVPTDKSNLNRQLFLSYNDIIIVYYVLVN